MFETENNNSPTVELTLYLQCRHEYDHWQQQVNLVDAYFEKHKRKGEYSKLVNNGE